MANQGEANGYYNNTNEGDKYPPPQGQPPNNYQQEQQYQQYQQSQANYNQQQQYSQAPPQYGPNQAAFNQGAEKPTFDQAFKVEKPKFNDWWAGALLLAVFAGYVAISGISLQGYGTRFPFLLRGPNTRVGAN